MPDTTLDCPHLQNIFKSLGLKPVTRQKFRREYVPQELAVVEAAKEAQLKECTIASLATDGWRNQHLARGAPLVSGCLMLPDGGSVFLRADNVSGVAKDGITIAIWHRCFIKYVKEKYGITIVCINGDGPSNNQKAFRLLTVGSGGTSLDTGEQDALLVPDDYADVDSGDEEEEELDMLGSLEPTLPPADSTTFEPTDLFVIWCSSHLWHLAVADVAKASGPVRETLDAAVKVSNTVRKSDKVASMLDAIQDRLGITRKSIPRHCPTRFAIRLTIMQAVFLDNADAFKELVMQSEWAQLGAKLAYGPKFNLWFGPASTMAKDRWPALIDQLLRPFKNAIIALEGNQPLASLVVPTWEALLNHAKEWQREVSKKSVDRLKFSPAAVVSALRARFQKHLRVSPVLGLAAILDPYTFITDESGDCVPDAARWDALLGEAMLERIEDDLVRVAKALGHDEKTTREEWAAFYSGRTSKAWNASLRLCIKDAVPVKTWLFAERSTPAVARQPANAKNLRFRVKAWTNMGAAVTGEHAHDGFRVLSVIARRTLAMHATSCSVERNWSAWKRLAKAERSCMSFKNVQQRVQIAEYYNGH